MMRKTTLEIRGLQTNVQEWGEEGAPKLFMLHGWMDCGATFNYMMPSIAAGFHVIAPDLRGFGDTDHAPGGYWFPDYFADLEILLNHYQPHGKVDLLGHSMGGNIAMLYAGIRPERVGRLLSLEALGLPPSEPADSTQKYRKWLTEILSDGESRVYPNANLLKHSIYKGNPQLPDHIIEDLAELWGKPVGDDGAMMLKGDHRHRYTNPVRYSFEDTEQIWREASAKTGLVMGLNSMMYQRFHAAGRVEHVKEIFKIQPQHYYEVENCGHMLHLEHPQRTAEIILDFFS